MLTTAVIIIILGTLLMAIGFRLNVIAKRVSQSHREEVVAMQSVPASMLDLSQLMNRRSRCDQIQAEVDENLKRLDRGFVFVCVGAIVFIAGLALLLAEMSKSVAWS